MGRKRIHLIGIGGAGLAALAEHCLARGWGVRGSDRQGVGATLAERLLMAGAVLVRGHRAAHVDPLTDWVVYSRAVPADNPELQAARRLGVPALVYSRALGRLLSAHAGVGVAVAGTHGKTTTAAALVHCLRTAGLMPAYVVGGEALALGRSGGYGPGPFVVEACEYGGSFLDLRPQVALLLNVEDDHAECYGGAAGVVAAFGRFVRRLPPEGLLLVPPALRRAVAQWRVRCRVLYVSEGPGGTYRLMRGGEGTLWLVRQGRRLLPFAPALPGWHNRVNLLFAAAAALELGAQAAAVAEGVATFRGVRRRFERLLAGRHLVLVDDYAHHPTEVEATLRTARRMYGRRRLRVVFEPHQYRRLERYLDAFARALSRADEVIVSDVYPAREEPEAWRHVRPERLVERLRAGGREARFVPLAEVAAHLERDVAAGDVVLTLGAGRIGEVAHALKRRLG